MKHNILSIDTAHDLIHFPHLTMQVKSAASDARNKPKFVLILYSIAALPMTKEQLQYLLTTHENGKKQVL